jgi:puromycin-sensitive aminopeptidase
MVQQPSSLTPLQDESPYRLPKTVVPERYELTIRSDLRTSTFVGQEVVTVHVCEPVHEIHLNASKLDIHEASLTNDSGGRLTGTVALDAETQRARIDLDGTAEPGVWSLRIAFSGTITGELVGFYRSDYPDPNGIMQALAVTQMEAPHARRVFPCWDEPEFKAVFAVTLIVDEALTAISNAAIVSERPLGDGTKEVTFADTIKMSTYLVAFVVGRLEATEPLNVDGTPLRVVFVPGRRSLTDYALEVGAFALRFFTRYYGIPYPGDKLDLIGLPAFAAGAMENLGAVTFRETALLVDRQTASRGDLEGVADTVAHEIAHMWFGDLVTMKWWNGLWLNEAFATFMELLAVDEFRQEWQRWVTFGLSRGTAMETDALSSTRPVEFSVQSPDDAESMFDVLTYQKGSSILRMLEQYLTSQVFQQGIRRYLDQHKFGNAETADLWSAIEGASGEPVGRFMHAWVFEPGFPIVTVEAGNEGRQLTLSQQRFRYLGGAADGARWEIPVMLRLGTEQGHQALKVLLSDDEATITLDQPVDWVVANEGGHGFYRVRYSRDLLSKLTTNVQEKLSPIERFNVVSDTWASVVAGLTPVPDFLGLSRLFGEEENRAIWVALLGGFGYLNRMLEPAQRPKLQAFVRALVGPMVERLGWKRREGESELISQLRGTLISALGVLGEDAATRAKAVELHAAYLTDRSAIDRDVVPAVIAIVADAGGLTEYELYLERQEASDIPPQEQRRYLFALASFHDQALIGQTLDKILVGAIRRQDRASLISLLLQNLYGGSLAWAFVRDHWEALTGGGEPLVDKGAHASMLAGVTALSDPELAEDVGRFFETHQIAQGAKTLEQHLERLKVNVGFRRREAPTLPDHF